ncbi:MAG: endonuclease [Cytophagales bacterium]|nr:MAG: endonuclease [Cytophagales bacterium]
MLTKQKGDIAEQAVILKALQLGFGVCKPIGDRLPYDLVFDVGGRLMKIQVKSAWFDEGRGNYVIDTRRTKTNRRQMVRSTYAADDFDFAIAFIELLGIFYIIPINIFTSYGSEIHLVETEKRQRQPKSALYREAWDLLLLPPRQLENCDLRENTDAARVA